MKWTERFIREQGACSYGVKQFLGYFPHGTYINRMTLRHAAPLVFRHRWWLASVFNIRNHPNKDLHPISHMTGLSRQIAELRDLPFETFVRQGLEAPKAQCLIFVELLADLLKLP